MNNSLRSSLKDNLSEELALPLIDIPDRAIDSLLALIESKLPEKKEHNNMEISGRDIGFNQAIDKVKSILKGGSDE